MASNAKLQEDILIIAKVLEIEVDIEDLTNEKLAALLSDLKAKQKDSENETQADTVVEAVEVLKVAKGKSITTKRGILVEGETITPSDLCGGKESFDTLKNGGYIA